MKPADFESHHIEGYAIQADGEHFKVPLFSQIEGNLWMGGCPEGDAPEEFKFIIDVYGREPYRIPIGTTRIQTHLYDSSEDQDWSMLNILTRLANDFTDLGKTLVHCQAGLNRSSLIVAKTLVDHQGMNPQQAIDHIRTSRHEICLCNQKFEQMILEG